MTITGNGSSTNTTSMTWGQWVCASWFHRQTAPRSLHPAVRCFKATIHSGTDSQRGPAPLAHWPATQRIISKVPGGWFG